MNPRRRAGSSRDADAAHGPIPYQRSAMDLAGGDANRMATIKPTPVVAC